MTLRCLLLGHKPYIEDTPQTERVGADVVIGPIRRYCGRCGITLPYDWPQVGDRRHVA